MAGVSFSSSAFENFARALRFVTRNVPLLAADRLFSPLAMFAECRGARFSCGRWSSPQYTSASGAVGVQECTDAQ